jgi:hypothetical protein
MSVMFLLGTPFLPALERLGWGGVTSAIGGACFLVQFVLSFGLGLALIRRPEFRVGAAVLVAIVPLIGLGLALGALVSDFAHPAYTEAAVYVGLTLLGCRKKGSRPASTEALGARAPWKNADVSRVLIGRGSGVLRAGPAVGPSGQDSVDSASMLILRR